MATLNAKRISILRNIVEAGFKDEKQIAAIGINEAARLPRCLRIDLLDVLDCMQAVKSNKLLSYLVEEDEKQEKHDET